MIWIFVILTVLVILFLERRWAPYALQYIRFSGQCSTLLAQPGEKITWTSTVENHSRLPIPFLRLELRFPNELRASGSELWVRGHCRSGIQRWTMEERLSLGPQRSRSRSIALTPLRRGEYGPGGCRLSIGDLLGFQETSLELPA